MIPGADDTIGLSFSAQSNPLAAFNTPATTPSGFWGNLLEPLRSAALGWGYGQATKSVAGRTPGYEMLLDPTRQPAGVPGAPGTIPTVQPNAVAAYAPFIVGGIAVIAGAVILARVLR